MGGWGICESFSRTDPRKGYENQGKQESIHLEEISKYLKQGKFKSEVGRFNVLLTFPKRRGLIRSLRRGPFHSGV